MTIKTGILLCVATTSSVAAFTMPPMAPRAPLWDTSELLSMAAFSPDDTNSDSTDSTDTMMTAKISDEMRMSKAIPFLKCPKTLQENADMAGNVGFDPLNFASSTGQLLEYREAEMKHSRLAMLAAVGWPASELWDKAFASQFGLEPMLDEFNRAPSLLNGGLERVSPIWWGFCLGLTAAIDMYGISKARRGDDNYRPGMLGFDPFNFYPADKKGQERVELAEIKHGRLAMLTVVSYSWQEWTTKMAVVDETPALFAPIF